MKFKLPDNYVLNKEDKTCFFIKKRIEELSCVKNIGERNRKWPMPDLKFIYSKLCRDYTVCSLDKIGYFLGEYDHATILHHINKFDDLFYAGQLKVLDIYNKICIELDRKDHHKLVYSKNNYLKTKNKLSIFKIIDKSNSIIKRQRTEIQKLKDLIYKN